MPDDKSQTTAKPCRCGKMAEAACNAMPNDWECELEVPATKPSHLRVDVAGVAIYVRTEEEYRHLEHTNRKLAVAKLALHRIPAQQVGASGVALKAIGDMKNV